MTQGYLGGTTFDLRAKEREYNTLFDVWSTELPLQQLCPSEIHIIVKLKKNIPESTFEWQTARSQNHLYMQGYRHATEGHPNPGTRCYATTIRPRLNTVMTSFCKIDTSSCYTHLDIQQWIRRIRIEFPQSENIPTAPLKSTSFRLQTQDIF